MGMMKKGENWVIDYYVRGRRKRETVGPNKALAENILRKRKVEIAENRYLDVKKREKLKFKDFAAIYLENHCKVNNKAWRNADSVYLNPENETSLVAYFGEKYLYEVTPFMIEQFKLKRTAEGAAPGTVNRMLHILSSLFNRAIDWGKAEQNPMKKVKLYKEENTRLRYLTKEEIQELKDTIKEKHGSYSSFCRAAKIDRYEFQRDFLQKEYRHEAWRDKKSQVAGYRS